METLRRRCVDAVPVMHHVLRMLRACVLVLVLALAACGAPSPVTPDARASDAAIADDAAIVDDAAIADDAYAPPRCDVGADHTCARWTTAVDPAGHDACVDYDGHGLLCADGAGPTRCDLASGSTCMAWVRSEPSGEWVCVDVPGRRCLALDPNCRVGSDHWCGAWTQTQPSGDWYCVAFDDPGYVCR